MSQAVIWMGVNLPSLEESLHALRRLPERWWEDEKLVEELARGTCPMLSQIGKTCIENDLRGPPSCKCVPCNAKLHLETS